MNNKNFIVFEEDFASIVFSTGEELDFNMLGKDFNKNIDFLKSNFNIKDIGYNKQIHGTIINEYKENSEVMEGDGLITNIPHVAIGVFTADCVPILILDEENKACGAVHSGWRGTRDEIVVKAIEKMKIKYKSNVENLKIFIGPHIDKCCYEVGEEVINSFSEKEKYNNISIYSDKKLNLSNCIKAQLVHIGVKEKNIKESKFCTYCSSSYKFFSYRKDKCVGRMFSFIYLK